MEGRDVMLSGANPARRLTYDDFLLFPDDDGLRHEIIDGEHYVTAVPNLRHQELVGRLHLTIGSFVEDQPERGHDIVEPDLVFVAPDQYEILTEKNIQGTPALVVEILSPSTRKRDRQLKRQLYDRTGVREYWLVDPDQNVVTIYRRATDGSFPSAAVLTAKGNDTLETPLLTGWSLALSRLFR